MDSIVVGIDDSAGAREALSWAAELARSTGARLRIVHAYETNIAWIDAYSADIPRWEARAREAAEQTLKQVATDVLDASQLEAAQLETVEGEPARVLHDQSRDADLVVVGSRGRGGFAGLLLGSVSQRVAQHSSCPVVIVPKAAAD